MRKLLLLALASCAASPSPTALPQQAPPGVIVATPAVSGQPITLRLSAGAPGRRVGFVASRSRPEQGACPPVLAGQCLDVIGGYVIGDVVSNARGEASLTRRLPLPPDSLLSLQAVVFTPAGPELSPTLTTVVSHPRADLDRDGLDAAAEVAAGSNPINPDSDGGGTIDGQEVAHDRTDPSDPADDVAVEADCADEIDGDGDGPRDCGDPDCGCPEVCGNGVDDDRGHDGDCTDSECYLAPSCAEVCGDGLDNDANNRADADDPACAASPLVEHDCADALDNDLDGLLNCADPDCAPGHAGCPTPSGEICDDVIDNDNDSRWDCQDDDCSKQPMCGEICDNGVDDDSDRVVDCRESACIDAPNCQPECFDGLINAFYGYDDIADSRCYWGPDAQRTCGDGRTVYDRPVQTACDEPECGPACVEDCTDGVDNDADWWADCADSDCAAFCREACADGVDNDRDALADCLDPDCEGRCPERCHNGTDDDLDGRADCDDPACHCAEVCDNGADDDHDGAADCADAACASSCGEVCDNGVDDDGDGLADCEDGSCVDLCSEVCDNGVDDNGDAWVDCQDQGCWQAPSCPAPTTVAWVTAGQLMAGQRDDHYPGRPQPCGALESRFDWGEANDVRGFVEVDHAGRADLCTWSVDEAWMRHFHFVGQDLTDSGLCGPATSERWDLHREGFQVGPGCGPLASADILPPQLSGAAAVTAASGTTAAFAAAVLPGGTAWYAGGSVRALERTSTYGVLHQLASTGPLAPAGAFGTCPTATLVRTTALAGGRLGTCAP